MVNVATQFIGGGLRSFSSALFKRRKGRTATGLELLLALDIENQCGNEALMHIKARRFEKSRG